MPTAIKRELILIGKEEIRLSEAIRLKETSK
jgi:hypothetical protein